MDRHNALSAVYLEDVSSCMKGRERGRGGLHSRTEEVSFPCGFVVVEYYTVIDQHQSPTYDPVDSPSSLSAKSNRPHQFIHRHLTEANVPALL